GAPDRPLCRVLRAFRRRAVMAMRVLVAGALGAALVVSAVSVPADPAGDRVHVIAKGDTLYSIARRYGVAVGALVSANRLASDRVPLRVGQRLVIPSAGV